MLEQQQEIPNEYLTAADNVYLNEMGDRISQLRDLHDEMDAKQRPWHWFKRFTDPIRVNQ